MLNTFFDGREIMTDSLHGAIEFAALFEDRVLDAFITAMDNYLI